VCVYVRVVVCVCVKVSIHVFECMFVIMCVLCICVVCRVRGIILYCPHII